MSAIRIEDLSETEIRILEELDPHGMRVEEIAERLGVSHPVAKRSVRELSDMGLLVSGPDFTYEPDSAEVEQTLEIV